MVDENAIDSGRGIISKDQNIGKNIDKQDSKVLGVSKSQRAIAVEEVECDIDEDMDNEHF